jgi:hypothetical protein
LHGVLAGCRKGCLHRSILGILPKIADHATLESICYGRKFGHFAQIRRRTGQDFPAVCWWEGDSTAGIYGPSGPRFPERVSGQFPTSPLFVQWADAGERDGVREDRRWSPPTEGCAVIQDLSRNSSPPGLRRRAGRVRRQRPLVE